MRIPGQAPARCCLAFALAVAVALGGCGGGPHAATRPATNATAKKTAGPSRLEQLESACSRAEARLKGIAKEAGLDDPQPAALRGHRLTRRLERGVEDSIAALRVSQASLQRLDAPDRARLALSEAGQEFESFKERLRAHVPRNTTAGLRLGFRFQRIGLEAGLKCSRSLGGSVQ